MKRGFLIFVLSAFVGMLFYACKKPKTYSDVPFIEFVSLGKFKSASGLDSATYITISFTDGDGDIGYLPDPPGNGYPYDDTLSVYYHNFIVSAFHKIDGVWVEDTVHERPPFPGFSGRLPYLTPTGNNKALKGEISMTEFVGYQNDTLRYTVYIYDRALHQSNTITTSEIVLTVR